MVTLEQLEESFGDDADSLHKYLLNKNRGGMNNSKGNTFENYFAVFKIADLWIDSFEPENIKLSSQALCFVDDLVLENLSKGIKIEHYQIKDIQGLSWYAKEHPLKDDFKRQYDVYLPRGIAPNLFLVVSNFGLKESLEENIPDEIQPFTDVIYFSTNDSITNLLRTNAEFKNKIEEICALSNPHMSALETAAVILLGAWDASNKTNVTLKELKENCARQNPNYLKGSVGIVQKRVIELLSEIKGFTLTIENGFLKWQYMDTDSGTISFAVGTRDFLQWENDVLQFGKFNTFEDLESFLQ